MRKWECMTAGIFPVLPDMSTINEKMVMPEGWDMLSQPSVL